MHQHDTPGHDASGPDTSGPDSAETETEAFWDDMYRGRDQVWSGNPNHWLVDLAEDLTPGSALDLGCGEGADSIWLANNGWTVTAIDVSPTALERTRLHATDAGVTARIEIEHHDLSDTFPAGAFDLVSAQFLQSPLDFPRGDVLRRAASAVAPGGALIIVSHAEFPPGAHDREPAVQLPTATEEVDVLELGGDWTVEVCDKRERVASRDGTPMTLFDNVVLVRRVS